MTPHTALQREHERERFLRALDAQRICPLASDLPEGLTIPAYRRARAENPNRRVNRWLRKF